VTIRAWRIVKQKLARTAFSGEGARRHGGRWNHLGTAMVYVAGSMSLAILEMLVHMQVPDSLARYVVFEVTFPEALVQTLSLARLPRTWRQSPASHAVRDLGDAWIAGAASAVLRVPAVVPNEWNYLLDPQHPDFRRIAIGPRHPIEFDARLLRP